MSEQDFHLRMKDPSAETPAVREWLDECERRIKTHPIFTDTVTFALACFWLSTGGVGVGEPAGGVN